MIKADVSIVTVPVYDWSFTGGGVTTGERTRSAYRGRIPSPSLKRGYRSFRLCANDFDKFFAIPKDATDVRLIATKSANEGAYLITEDKNRWGDTVFNLDGFEVPGLYSGARMCLKQLLRDGYTYIRFDYRTI